MSLRIVAGTHRGRMLRAPEGLDIRPTSARARESLFNILAHADFGLGGASPLAGARVLDAFAGVGALGIEALSRGAAHCTFMDKSPVAVRAIGDNLRMLKETERALVLRADATQPQPSRQPCSLCFLDPPYRSGDGPKAMAGLARAGWLAPGAVVTLELARTEDAEAPPGFVQVDERRYGAAKILIYRCDG